MVGRCWGWDIVATRRDGVGFGGVVSDSLIRDGKRWRVTPWIAALRLEGSL